MNLWRVLDSTGDLYKAATSKLSYHALYDIIHDFFAYFVLNVFVVMFAVLAACLPPGDPKSPSEIWRQIRGGLCHFSGWVHKNVSVRTSTDDVPADPPVG